MALKTKNKSFFSVRNVILFVIIIALVVVLAILVLTKCGSVNDRASVGKPQLNISGNTVTWAENSNVSEFEVIINAESVQKGSENSFIITDDVPSDFTLLVKAYSKKDKFKDAQSDTLSLKRLTTPEMFLTNEDEIVWNKVSGADSYVLTIDGAENNFSKTDSLIYKLGATDKAIKLQAFASNSYLLDSKAIETALSNDKLSTPDVKVNGALVSWDTVSGALSYNVYINGALSQVTTSNSYLFSISVNNAKISVSANGFKAVNLSDKSETLNVTVNEVMLVETALQKVLDFASFKIEVTGTTDAVVGGNTVKQVTEGERIFNNNSGMFIFAKTYGTFAKFGHQFYYKQGAENVYFRSKNPDANMQVDWKGQKGSAQAKENFESDYGRDPMSFFTYIVNANTISAITQRLNYDSASKLFSFTMSMNVGSGETSATSVNVKEVMNFGGLLGCTYKSCLLSFEIDSEMKLKSVVSVDNYSAKASLGTADTTTVTTQNFYYYNAPLEIDTSWIA